MISSFKGKYSFLSNFYYAPFYSPGGLLVKTVEHGFHACKTFNTNERNKILAAKSPGEAKRLGRRVVLRKDWNTVRLTIMKALVLMKFQQNQDIKKQLIETGNIKLVEGNTWNDRFWGVCNRQGQNHLGKILMEVRNELAPTH